MTSPSALVVGAGVLGLASAAELAARGVAVTVVDSGEANASSVAAGMIAPAMESALDDPSAEAVAVLKAARALWPAFAARQGLTLVEDGADWRGPGGEAIAARLAAQGFRVRTGPDGVHAPDDARIRVGPALDRLRSTARTVVGRVVEASPDAAGWRVRLTDGGALRAEHLILATGAAGAAAGLPSSVATLIDAVRPIRGQIVRAAGDLPRVVRTPDGYAVPDEGGLLIGASMEPGRRDLGPDVEAARAQAAAVRHRLGLAPPTEVEVRVGVRGAFADGLPAVGALDGVIVALAPRRNGWLLAPLVARVVADAVQGAPRGDHAAALDPRRPGLTAG